MLYVGNVKFYVTLCFVIFLLHFVTIGFHEPEDSFQPADYCHNPIPTISTVRATDGAESCDGLQVWGLYRFQDWGWVKLIALQCFSFDTSAGHLLSLMKLQRLKLKAEFSRSTPKSSGRGLSS